MRERGADMEWQVWYTIIILFTHDTPQNMIINIIKATSSNDINDYHLHHQECDLEPESPSDPPDGPTGFLDHTCSTLDVSSL